MEIIFKNVEIRKDSLLAKQIQEMIKIASNLEYSITIEQVGRIQDYQSTISGKITR